MMLCARMALTLCLVGTVCACAEQPYRHYPDAAAAIEAGELRRGWLAAWFPRSATDVHLQGDLDDNAWWVRARLSGAAADSLRAALVPVDAGEVRARRPRGSGRWWFESLIEQHPANDNGLYADLFRGRGDPVPGDVVVAFDRFSEAVYVWNGGIR